MEEKDYEEQLKGDFKNFLFLVWDELKLPQPSRVQYDIADYLQDPQTRKMIQAMRGAGKSYITAAYAVWCLYRNPDTTIICISAVQNRAREFIRLSRKIIDTIPYLQHLVPNPNDRDGADRFDVGCRTTPDKNPSVAAYGIKSMITGSHADMIIVDDVEIPQNSMTVEARELLLQRCKELESVLNPDGRIVFLGTPQSFDSVYRHLGRSYPVRKWTARYPSPDSLQAENLSPLLLDDLARGTAEVGQPTYPEYYSHETLIEREAIMGTSNFQLQMQLDTTLSDATRFPLLVSNLIVHPVSPHGGSPKVLHGTLNPCDIESPSIHPNDKYYKALHYENTIKDWTHVVMAIDPAGRGSDSTAVTVLCELNGMVHMGCLHTFNDPSATTFEAIAGLISYWNVKEIVIESNFGDGMFTSLLTPHLPHPCAITEVRHNTAKEQRIIDILQPITENHRLVIDPSVAKHPQFQHQYTHLQPLRGALKHDDAVDALAMGLQHLKPYIAIDPQETAKRRAEQEQMKEIKGFLRAYEKQNAGKERENTRGWMRYGGRAEDKGGPPRGRWGSRRGGLR